MSRKKKKPTELPIMKAMCATCPFKDGSGTEYLRADITASALREATRICHSTGSNNAFHHRTGKPPHVCRGARDVQLKFFHRTGFIMEPTDEAWLKKCKEMGLV